VIFYGLPQFGFVLDQFTVWGEPLECARRLEVLAADAPGATGFRVKLPLPLRSRTLSDYTGDVEALGEVIAAYRRRVGARRGRREPIAMRKNRVKQLLKAGEPALWDVHGPRKHARRGAARSG